MQHPTPRTAIPKYFRSEKPSRAKLCHEKARRTRLGGKKPRHTALSVILALAACATCFAPAVEAAELDYISVGGMYMAYFNFDSGSGQLTWDNAGDYAFDGPQVLRPLSATHPGDYYTSSVPAANLLNPHAHGGLGAASSRLFGFSLTGALRNYLSVNGYALAIQLQSVTFAGTADTADNVSVYYYNRGNDDWGSYHQDKTEWSELSASNYLIWNGQGFSNMVHPLVLSTDAFAANYTLTYTLSIIEDATGANVNATVVDAVTAIAGTTPLTFAYTAESLGATPIPEPLPLALLFATTTAVAFRRKAKRRRSRM